MLQIAAALFYYKLGQRLLEIGTTSLLQIGANVVTNCGSCYKLGHRYYKIGQPTQIGTKRITNWCRYYKLEQLLQIGEP